MAKIVGGGLQWHEDEGFQFKEYLRKFEGKWVWVTVEKFSKQRSLNQNRYYWGVVVKILADEIGYSKDEMHDALRWEFLNISEDEKALPTVKSTTELSTIEMETYLEEIREWADTQLDIYIPLPNEIGLE